MIFFSRKHKILETPLFEGFKDYHNHTLPAVDDGVRSLEESLAVLSYFEQLKISEVVLTPHVMSGVNDTDEDVLAAYASLTEAYDGSIKLSLAGEYMLDSGFNGHLESGVRKLYDDNVLVETSYFSAPAMLNEMLYDISCAGLTPVIAHPERYSYMPREKYHKLREREYALQLNLLSFTSIYGGNVTGNALYLLENDMYSYMGTDLHSLRVFKSKIAEIKLSTKHIDKLLALK